MRSKRWCFTLNNFTEDDEIWLLNLYENGDMDVSYLIFEEEHMQDGTPHLQGYIEFNKRKRMQQVKNAINQRAHVEVARGTPQQNIAYCSKEGDPYEFGDHTSAGETNQWAHIRTLVHEGNLEQIEELYFGTYVQHMKALEALCTRYAVQAPPWDGDLKEKNLWIWGPPGVGKSRYCRTEFGNNVYPKNCNKWWDGFRGQDVVVVEDLDPDRAKMLVQHLKVWMDRYVFEAERKGGSLLIRPEFKFIITSNYAPEQCFQNPEDLDAIRRRCQVMHMDTFA